MPVMIPVPLCVAFALLALLLPGTPCHSEPLVLSLGVSQIELDGRGRVVAVRSGDGREFAAVTGASAFELATSDGVFQASEVTRAGKEWLVRFGERGQMRLVVEENTGFARVTVKELEVPGTIERLQLFCLPVKGLRTVGSIMNACYDESFATAVMATHINVHARSVAARAGGVNNQDCTHRFTQSNEQSRQGRFAARFEATSRRADNAGWSMVGRSFAQPLDLRGLRAIRAWVHGDGSGQMLKIQLNSGSGYRDDYIKIDFTGWRQVVLGKPALNTLSLERVSRLNFYYNSLPANRTVSCLLDQVEAMVGEGADARTIPLEDFEDPASELWPSEGTRLIAETLRQHGIQPAGVGILACPRAQFEDTIVRFEKAAGLPSPHLDGYWNKTSPSIKRSYLFVTAFSEADTEDVIAFARRGRFDAILMVQSSWCSSTGHYPINTHSFPGGLDSLKRTVARIQKAGFKVGLHYLAPSIYPPDAYLTPVPDARLVRDAFGELGTGVDAKAGFIPTRAAPERFPAEDGGYRGKGSVIQIDNELIQYGERSLEPPFGFKQCRRGILGTVATAHAPGARVGHLLKSYGYFLFDMDTNLVDEVADNLARVVNATGVDMIYWDGSEQLQGDHWYYNAKLHQAFYDRFENKNLLIQSSSYSHYSWHINTRHASADGHGDLKGYLDERTPGFQSYWANLMPLDIGWYYVYNTETTTDQFEYVLNKSLGFDSSISLQTSPRHIREHPYIDEIVDLIGAYEQLRLSGNVPVATRERLREPKKDFRFITESGQQVLQRVIYEPFREIHALDGVDHAWTVEVPEDNCWVGAQVLLPGGPWLAAGPSYQAAGSVLLEDFEDLKGYAGHTLDGVSQSWIAGGEGAREGHGFVLYTATSTRPADDGWCYVAKTFPAPLDLSATKGIGLWLRGDGGGGKFKLQLRDGKGALDYYLNNDVSGWRYHQLARPAKDAIDYTRVTQILFYYNGLPGKKTIVCGMDGVRALPALDVPVLKNPRLEVDGQVLSWLVDLEEGGSLTFWPGAGTRVTGNRKSSLPELASPAALKLAKGKHAVRFGVDGALLQSVKARLMLATPERLPVSGGGEK